MLSHIFIFALTFATLVSAHGKVTVVTGNAGGNGTALGIRGGVVPNTGSNSKTEVDTTVFTKTNILTDGLGKTTGSGKNSIAMLIQAMHLSGTTLPQITSGGNLTGTFHVVTADGAGPIQAVLDPTATGRFATGIPLTVVEQIPGVKGNFVTTQQQKGGKRRSSLWERAVEGMGFGKLLGKRGAANVNQSFGFAFAVPANTTCTGTVASMTGVCLVKIANANRAGPFGGVVPVQIAGGGGGCGEFGS
ncbi:hypothetical protein C8A01DRAFT_49482 [Parachaetomium inaequale]|uniref:Uncharacterized protein n=1 Tax=Parachaetomium inaequale TaxID=2588326 RepID=A0AAN6SNT6_9PEZI|nr:hypothetical protein C8A01DRAFT_49482 [Parachaetomium inaequale]